MKKKFKKLSYILGCVLSLYFIASAPLRAYSLDADHEKSFMEGRYLIENYFVEGAGDNVLKEGNLKDMVKALNDPYSTYMSAEESKEFVNSINNKFYGIGVTVETATEGVKVISVFDKSPALESEIKPGDIITEANGKVLGGLASEAAVQYIRGQAGTFVDLKILRGQTVITKRVERREISAPTVTGKVLDKHIGYIGLSSFGEGTPAEFKAQLDKLNAANVDSYIIDLRFNSGGYTGSAYDIAGYFIGGNPVMEIRAKDGQNEMVNAVSHGYTIDKPVVLLVNEYSASASEILTAAIKDYNKAIIIGEKTYGKGVAQSMFELSDGSYLKLTVYKFYSPKGKEINKIGIKPDIEVKDEGENAQDPLAVARTLLGAPSKNVYKLGAVRAGVDNMLSGGYQKFLKYAQ